MSDNRTDLPSPSAPNFQQRLRETIQTYLGRQGSPLDRGLTLRDLLENGIVSLKNGFTLKPGQSGTLPLNPGSAVEGVYEPDLTPPPVPTGLVATAAISHILIEHDAPLYSQGHGHLRTRLYGATRAAGAPAPVFSDAVEIAQFSGTVYAHPSNPATTWHLWVKWETVDGVLSAAPAGGTNGIVATTGQDVSKLVFAMTGPGNPFKVVTEQITLPDGTVVPPGTYTADAFIHNGQITNAKIANLAVDDAKIANLSVGKLTAGSIAIGEYVQSTGYVAGSAGWRIDGNGNAEFGAASIRDQLAASQIDTRGLSIKDADGNVILAAGTALDFSTGVGGSGKPADGANNTYLDIDGSIQGVSSGSGTSVSNTTLQNQFSGTNLAVGSTFTSSTSIGNSANLTDNVIAIQANNYAGFGDGAQWLQADFGSVKFIGENRAFWWAYDGRTYQYAIAVSKDGSNWAWVKGSGSTAGVVSAYVTSRALINDYGTSGNGTVRFPTIDSVNDFARYIRIYANGNTSNAGNHLYEWQLWSGGAPVDPYIEDYNKTVAPGATVGATAGVNLKDSSGNSLADSAIKNTAISAGQNLIPNSDWTSAMTVGGSWNPDGAVFGHYLRYASELWANTYALQGVSTRNVVILQNGKTVGGDGGVASDTYPTGNWGSGIPVVGGKRYCFSYYGASHRCDFGMYWEFRDSAGNAIVSAQDTQSSTEGSADTLSLYKRPFACMTAPPNAATAGLAIRKFNTYSFASDSYFWFAAPQFEVIGNDANAPGPYNPGPATNTRQLGYSGDLNATVGAPTGTLVAGVAAETVAANAAAVANKLDKASSEILTVSTTSATRVAGLRVGDITWDASGNRDGGKGLALTPSGVVAHNGAKHTFALNATTGEATFSGEITASSFATGAFTGYAWPAAGQEGSYLGPDGLLLGNYNNSKYFQVTSAGNVYAPGMKIEDGALTISQANVINTLQIAGQAVTVSNQADGTALSVSTTLTIPANTTMAITAVGSVGSFTSEDSAFVNWSVPMMSISIDQVGISDAHQYQVSAQGENWTDYTIYATSLSYGRSITNSSELPITVTITVTGASESKGASKSITAFGFKR